MLKVVRNLICCVCLLFALSILVFSGSSANADTVDYIVNVAPSLNITLSTDNVVLDLNPNTKTSDAKDLNIKVSTNNMTGYQLTMSSAGNATDLVRNNTADGKNATIPTLSNEAGATAASLTDNTWGYKKDSGNFIPYVSGTKLLENKRATNLDETTLSFASKINYNQAAGSYELSLVLTGVANPMMNYIQDFNPAFCTSDPTQVLDIRDMQEYTIQRLADGNCWMITNLNLGAVDLEEDLTSENTDISDTVTANTFNSWKKSSGTGTYVAAEYIPISGTDPTSQTPYGTIYNYCAASGGDSRACVSSMSSQLNPSYSICPKGWRLPTGGSTGEFQTLYNNNAYNTVAKMRAPIANGGAAFALPGVFHDSTPFNRNSTGNYWSSTRYNTTGMHLLNILTSAVDPATYGVRASGFAIRCILKETRTLSDIIYMQDINPQIVANTANGATNSLKDIRDNKTYTVAKINGYLWMTQNLRFVGDYTNKKMVLNSATSDVESIYTVSNPLEIDYRYLSEGDFTASSTLQEGVDTIGNPTAWYNYASASANQIISNVTTQATRSVCPAGWRLPTNAEQSTVVSYKNDYNAILTGNYSAGSLVDMNTVTWWASTSGSTTGRYRLLYDSSTLSVNNIAGRQYGRSVRCIAK